MKNRYLVVCSLLVFIFLNVNQIDATSGKLKSSSIVTCNGVTYGNHGDGHWHVAVNDGNGWYPSGSSIGYTNPCVGTSVPSQTPTQTYVKSSNTSLQNVLINNEISVIDSMRYTTKQDSVILNVVPADNRTAVYIGDTANLVMGPNEIIIKMIAEDGTTKEHILTIVREKIKSKDNKLKSVKIEGESIEVKEQMEVIAKHSFISVNAIANDKFASVELSSNANDLDIGDNKVLLTVIAENGDKKIYIINVKRLSDDIGLSVCVNGEKIEFNSFRKGITVTHDVEEVNLDYVLDDKRSKVKVTYNKKLTDGENIIAFDVTAENGDRQRYEVVVTRTTFIAEIFPGIALTGIGIFGGLMGFKYYKKIKN